mmetsp:Transcript_21953/g.54241  ORF Transcript_21953/g.54241 Transcript_21953/m.54241 type:complete len:884 (+) Transcript_21953:26-2677(+)
MTKAAETETLSDVEHVHVEVSEYAQAFFEMSCGFLKSKKEFDRLADGMVDLQSVASFGGTPVQTEDVNHDGAICLDDVYDSATMIKPTFDEWIRNFGQEIGLSDQFIKIPSTLKAKERAIEKVKDDYDGDFGRLGDIVRASLVTSNKDEAFAVWKLLEEKQQAGEAIEIVRLKNRFATPPFNGYRDLLVSFKFKMNDICHVCELQVHYAPISALKKKTHKYYQFFRTYFKGNIDAVNERLRVLDATIGQSTATSLYNLIQEICSSEDMDRFDALQRLLGNEMMDEQEILRVVREAELQTTKKKYGESSNEAADCMMRLGKAYRKLGDNKVAKALFHKVLEIRRSNLSDHDESTLGAAYYLGVTLRKLKLFDEALPLITETLQLQKEHLGMEHRDTLKSMNNIASLRMAMGDYEVAHGLHTEAFEARKAALGANNQDTLQSQGCIAAALGKLGRYKDAADMFKSLVTDQETILGPTHSDALMSLENLAACLEEADEFKNEDAIVQYQELRKRQRKKYGSDDKSTEKTKATIERLALDVYGSQVCIVDGGSRGTRCYTFEMESAGTLKRHAAPKQLEKLDSILFEAKKNGKGVNGAATVIGEWLSECGVSKDIGLLYIGGTAGLRTAIDCGKFSDGWVLGVEEALSKQWPVVFFEAISGQTEAALELAATRFAASSNLHRDGVGLLSLGGGSTQMVEHMGDSHHSFYFGCRYVTPKDTSLKPVYFKEDILYSPEALADEHHSALEAANAWRNTVSEALSEVEESSKLSGSYVAISTTYWVARFAGISSRLLTVAEAKEGIRRYHDKLLQESPLTADWRKMIEENPKDAEKLSSNIVVDVVLDRMFRDDAEIYFERQWKVPSTSDNEFITNWPTGKALEILVDAKK